MARAYLKNMKNVIANLEGLGKTAIKHFEKDAAHISNFMLVELTKDATRTDYSLSDLRRMGHPYGRKPGDTPPHEDPLIHEQSGLLADNIKPYLKVTNKKITMSAKINGNKVKYLKHLINGTSTMIARPIFTHVWDRIGDECLQRVSSGLSKAFTQQEKRKRGRRK